MPRHGRFQAASEVAPPSRVITIIEVLSPSNKKPGDGRIQYLRKQEDCLHSRVNLIEIDLVRTGDWTISIPKDAIEAKHRTPYRVDVRYGWRRFQADYYPIPLSKRLPTIQVPLRPTDTDVPLDLQALIEQCYEDGAYDDIDYTIEPEPPLSPADARWAAQLLRRAGLRVGRKRK